MDEHDLGEAGVWKCTDNTPTPFLDDPDASFDVTDVLRRSCGIQCSLWDVVLDLLEFIIHQNGVDVETGTRINVDDAVEEGPKFGSGTRWYMFNRR